MKSELIDLPATAILRLFAESSAEDKQIESIIKALTGSSVTCIGIEEHGQKGISILAKHKSNGNKKAPKAPKVTPKQA